MTVPSGLFIGAGLPSGINTRLFSSLPPLVALHSTSLTRDASYLQPFASKGRFLKSLTSMPMLTVLNVLVFSISFLPLPLLSRPMIFWLVIGTLTRTLSVIGVLLHHPNNFKHGLTCSLCLLLSRMLLLQALLLTTSPSIRSTVTLSLCTLVWTMFL